MIYQLFCLYFSLTEPSSLTRWMTLSYQRYPWMSSPWSETQRCSSKSLQQDQGWPMYEGQLTGRCVQCPLRLFSHSGWKVFLSKVVFLLCKDFFISKLRSFRGPRAGAFSAWVSGSPVNWRMAVLGSADHWSVLYFHFLVFSFSGVEQHTVQKPQNVLTMMILFSSLSI